jgi:DNA polymerase-3 subunit alpha
LIDLAIVYALFNPSSWNLKSELIYAKNKHDRTLGFDNFKINEILLESYGLLIFQETFMHIANEFGAFTFAETEIWRKGIFIDKSGFKMEEFLLEFSNSCRQKNTLNEYDISVLTKLISNYLPNTYSKAHAISYASIAYWGAYYKTYYPFEFIEVFYTEEDIPF